MTKRMMMMMCSLVLHRGGGKKRGGCTASLPSQSSQSPPSSSRFLLLSCIIMVIFSLLPVTMASTPHLSAFPAKTNITCSADSDCLPLNLRLPKNGNVAVYACIDNVCAFTVAAGEICKKASDCAQFQWVERQLRRNLSIEAIIGRPVNNITVYLESLCSPTACTIASGCNSFSDPLFNTNNQLLLPEFTNGQACCLGGREEETCTRILDSEKSYRVSTCEVTMECTATGSNPLDNTLRCQAKNFRSQLWVGVTLTLIGASMLNVGLNLQKLALRKRHEKKQEKKLQNRMRIIQKLAAVRLAPLRLPSFGGKRSRTPSFHNLFSRNRESNAEASAAASASAAAAVAADATAHALAEGSGRLHRNSTPPPPNDEITPHEAPPKDSHESQPPHAHFFSMNRSGHHRSGRQSAMSDSQSIMTDDVAPAARSRPASRMTSRTLNFGIDLPRPMLRITNKNTISATVTKPDGTTEDISIPAADEDKAEFSKKLDFGSLLKNPVWLLGFLVFILSNFVNFVALQFAPQSLVATLGSISLVVNVILAPIINQEKFTWRDVVGVVLIVAGSSMTVVFSGVNSKDYKLCVLLALFRRIPTIVFLTVTLSLVVSSSS
ncbi:hypothetical protein BC829DRAFT_486104 [Chytridium lagenaria]|nr:hypothetical protein BC829DRAFT_486104 [Chytridium lagenaria]